MTPRRRWWTALRLAAVALIVAAIISIALIKLFTRPGDITGATRQPVKLSAQHNPGVASSLAIPKAEVKYLQDVEHFGGFVLGDLAFQKITQTLRGCDASALTAFLSDQFRGQLFDDSTGRTADYRFAQLRDWREEHEQKRLCDRDQFVGELLRYRDEFAELRGVGLSVMLMSPEVHGVLDGPWKGTCKLRLAGRTQDGTLAERVIKFRCRIKGITDETPSERGWLLACDAYAARYCQAPQPLMKDITAETGIDVNRLTDTWKSNESQQRPFITGGVYLADFDQDGLLDVLVTDLVGLFLYKGESNGKYTHVTPHVGLPSLLLNEPLAAAFADLDGDGFEDLLVGSNVFRNEQGQRFRRLTPGVHTSLTLPPWLFGYSVVDYDCDGKLDLYLVGLTKGSQTRQPWIGTSDAYRNQLWRNLGNWQFKDVTEQTGTAGNGRPTFAAVWFDANGDDWPDVMTACETGQNDYFINQRDGTFRPGTLPDGFGGFSMGISVDDIDNDGYGDPYVGNMYSKAGERIVGNLKPRLYPPDVDAKMRDFVSGNELYHNQGDGTFKRIGQSVGVSDVGWAYGTCFGDLNNDGFVDLYAAVGFQSVTPDRPDG